MQIPHGLLSPGALRAIVEEFVARDGTDHTAIEPRIERVLHQLDVGSAELHFEEETANCNIRQTIAGKNLPAGNGGA